MRHKEAFPVPFVFCRPPAPPPGSGHERAPERLRPFLPTPPRMRHLRRVRPPGRRQARLLRALRPAAPRPGKRRHRRLRRSPVAIHKDMGLVADVFNERTLQKLTGHLAIGHVRYSTTGESTLINTQPFLATHKGMSLSVAHNGNLVNSMALRRHLEQQGSIFQTTMDSEIVIHLMARHLDRGLRGGHQDHLLVHPGGLLAAAHDPGHHDRGARPPRFPAALPGRARERRLRASPPRPAPST